MAIDPVLNEQLMQVTMQEWRDNIGRNAPRYRMELHSLGAEEYYVPKMCSLCGVVDADLIMTPWEHFNLCDGCAHEMIVFGRVMDRLLPHDTLPRVSHFEE